MTGLTAAEHAVGAYAPAAHRQAIRVMPTDRHIPPTHKENTAQ